MMQDQRLRGVFGVIWGLLLFFVVAWSLRLALGSMATASPIIAQVALKTTLVLVALIGWRLLGRPFSEMGWRRADWWNRSYLAWFAISAVAMMGSSVAVILLDTRHPIASQMRFWQIVTVVWLLSSFSEEVYVRGLVQSWMARDEVVGNRSAINPSVVSSALLFAAMHVSLMWSPMGIKGGLMIVLATLGVGWACAVLRDRSGSLWPAFACHVAGNVAGIPGGIVGLILYRLVFGHMPEFMSQG